MCRDTDVVVPSMPSTPYESTVLRVQGQQVVEKRGLCQEPLVEVAADSCLLAAVQLVAVQPACLRAHQHSPVPPQGPQQDNSPANPSQQREHDVLLHLEAVLSYGHMQGDSPLLAELPHSGTWHRAAFQTSAMHPLLQHAMLEVVVLNRCMQLIQQQQFSLLDLVLQQQQQHHVHNPHMVTSTAKSITSSCCTVTSGSTKTDSWHPVGLCNDNSQATVPLTCCGAGSHSWSVYLNVHVSFPNWPSPNLIDALHLVLVVRTPAAASNSMCQQISSNKVDGSNHSSSGDVFGRLQPGPALIAEVPLLVLPAVAQQEVQQLLLPAMRQEVQAEQQQEQALGEPELTAAQLSASYMQMEGAVWRHFSQLANDMFTVLQLAAESAATADAVHAAETATAAVAVIPVAAGQDVAVLTPAGALADMAQSLLFPLLLPFLAAHGLHNLLMLLVSCLPVHLQQQWRQQQQERLGLLAQLAPAARCLPGEGNLAHAAAPAAADARSGLVVPACETTSVAEPVKHHSSNKLLLTAQSGTKAQHDSSSTLDLSSQQHHNSGSLRKRPTHHQKSTAAAGGQGLLAEADAVPVTSSAWYAPLAQFAPDVESRYLDWKHRSLLNLDYLGAVFAVMYLAVLVRKLMREPATLFYVMFILIKTLPHVPLILGFRHMHLRYREQWLFLVAPACLLLTWCFSMHSIVQGRPAVLLPNRAYKAFWSGRAELATSAMRLFTQHMRLRKYILHCLLDGMISAWMFGQVFGVLAAAQRWLLAVVMSVGVGWAFELCMRQRFVDYEQQRGRQQQQR